MTLPDFLQYESGGTYIRLTGHRIGLANVVRLYDRGYGAELIASHYPTLPLSLVHKVIAFYLENSAEVSGYVARDTNQQDVTEAAARHANPTPTIAELRRRLESVRQVGG